MVLCPDVSWAGLHVRCGDLLSRHYEEVRGGGCRACTHVALALSIPAGAVLVYVASECLQVVIRALMMLVACVAAIATRCGERRAASITVLEILSRQVKTPPRGEGGSAAR